MTLVLVALLSYCLWSPTVYATHYAFVKSGVTSSGIPIQEEDVYDSQFGMERISRRIVGFQVNLHMHHPTEPATSTHEAIPSQEVEVEAPMLSPNIPMTMDEINVALSATFDNLRRVVPSDSTDFVNLQILIGKLQEKIVKCGASENEIASNDNNRAQQDAQQTAANPAEPNHTSNNIAIQDQPKDPEEKSEHNKHEPATAAINEPENEKNAESAALPAQAQIIETTESTNNSPKKLGKESEDNQSETNKSEEEQQEPPKPPEPVDSHKNAPDESVKQQDKIAPAQEKQNEVEELERMVEELVGNGTETAEIKEPEAPIMDKVINDADVQNSKTADAATATATEKEAAENDENIHDNALQQPHNVRSRGSGTINGRHYITINGGNVDDVDAHQRKIDSDETGHSAVITKQDEQENINVMQEIINLADIIERHNAEEEKQKTKGKEGVHETSKTSLNE